MNRYLVQNIWVEVLAVDEADAQDTVWAALDRVASQGGLDDGTEIIDWGGDVSVRPVSDDD